MVESYHGPLGDPATTMAVFYYNQHSNLYRFGRRWGSATNYEQDPGKQAHGHGADHHIVRTRFHQAPTDSP